MSAFYSRLSYSFGNEDERTEQKALRIEPTSRVFCITASGDRPLHLLLGDPQEIVAVDANRIQNNLFHLKAAAIRELDFDEYMAFMGADPHPNRLASFEKVAAKMPDETARYWRGKQEMISKGILWQGAVERLTKFWSPLHPFLGLPVKKLFACNTLEQQKNILETQWNHKLWKRIFKFLFHPRLVTFLIRDPGLYGFLDPEIQLGSYIYDRLIGTFEHTLAKENALVSLIFRGVVTKEAFPPYLQEEGVHQIKGRVHRVQTVTGDAIRYLEEVPEGSFDRFSFSDIASYLPQADFERMLEAMVRAAKPGSRFCIRQCFSGHQIPERLAIHLQREPDLEAQLEKEDRAFVYRYLVGTVN